MPFGYGWGWGCRWFPWLPRWWWLYYPAPQYIPPLYVPQMPMVPGVPIGPTGMPQMAPESERKMLETQAKQLENQLKQIEKRIKEIK